MILRQLCLLNLKSRLIIFSQLIDCCKSHNYISLFSKKKCNERSLNDARLVVTAGSSNGRAACVVDSKGHVVQTDPASAQTVALRTVAVLFQLFADKAFNL